MFPLPCFHVCIAIVFLLVLYLHSIFLGEAAGLAVGQVTFIIASSLYLFSLFMY